MKVFIFSFVITSVILICSICKAEELDPIALLAGCGSECWAMDHSNKSPNNINPEKESFDGIITKCMQVCFADKTKKEDKEEILSPIQIKKIKVSAYCGYICYPNNKMNKKSLNYCYAGCLGSILQAKPKI